MSNYTPDNWVVLKIDLEEQETPLYKILAGWSGGYLSGDTWRMSSGITRVEEDDHAFYFYGSSGSVYECNKSGYGLRMNDAHIWEKIRQHRDGVELMDENTDWKMLDFQVEV